MIKMRVWDKNAKYIGDVYVPEALPQIVTFGIRVFAYNATFNVYSEANAFDVTVMDTSKVKREVSNGK